MGTVTGACCKTVKKVLKLYAQKVARYGIRQSGIIIARRLHRRLTLARWRRLVSKNSAAITWGLLCSEIGEIAVQESFAMRSLSFSTQLHYFFTKNNSPLSVNNPLENSAKSRWDLDTTLDFTGLRSAHTQANTKADSSFSLDIFYGDLAIREYDPLFPTHAKDIKVPWELARFHHALGWAQQFSDTGDAYYRTLFFEEIAHFLSHNRFMCGIHWLNPMEVALRAINWIWGITLIHAKDSTYRTPYLESIICSLYDHLVFIESNWELYDGRTSNHYLSNLVGHLYICWFFKDAPKIQKKAQKVFKQFCNELDTQIFSEGMSYEGSTKYHALVTELVFHGLFISQELGLEVPSCYYSKLQAMHKAQEWLSVDAEKPTARNLVSIGDDDSGAVLGNYYIPRYEALYPKSSQKSASLTSINLSENFSASCFGSAENNPSTAQEAIHWFPEFGLTCIKQNNWHITVRHHAYKKRQPSGHFHQDAHSITVSYNNHLFMGDPGSYCYTGSRAWRNYFRSFAAHNTFFIPERLLLPEQQLGASPLFGLQMLEQEPANVHIHAPNKNTWVIHSYHDIYHYWGLQAHRTVRYTPEQVTITDWWEGHKSFSRSPFFKTGIPTQWNFTCTPDTLVSKQLSASNKDEWLLTSNIQELENSAIPSFSRLILNSPDLFFTQEPGFYAPQYGVHVACQKLQATHLLSLNQRVTIQFHPI